MKGYINMKGYRFPKLDTLISFTHKDSEFIISVIHGVMQDECNNCHDINRLVDHDGDLDLYKCHACGNVCADGNGVVL